MDFIFIVNYFLNGGAWKDRNVLEHNERDLDKPPSSPFPSACPLSSVALG
jgi:hypothetical protein